jgi:hypothetical protein
LPNRIQASTARSFCRLGRESDSGRQLLKANALERLFLLDLGRHGGGQAQHD